MMIPDPKLWRRCGFMATVLFAALLLVIGSASAHTYQDLVKSSTLTKVLERGVLRVGINVTGPPWGFMDKNYKPTGFDFEIAQLMAKELGVKLEPVEVTNANRVPYLVSGKVDIIIACFANTLERAKSVSFSKPYAPFFLVVVGRKDDKDFKSWRDLPGRKIAIPRSTTSDMILSEIAPKGTIIMRYENQTDAFLALEQGKVDAFAEGYDLAAYQVARHPDWEIKGKPFARTFPCMGVPLGDVVWLDWVNLFIEHKLNSGEIQKLYEKYFNVEFPEGIWPSF